MNTSEVLPSLIFMTLGITLLAAIAALLIFRRKKSNRHPLEGREERNVGADLDAGIAAPEHSPKH